MKISNAEKNYSEQAGLDTNRLLSEAESCVLAGITLDTLRSYTQFSLLKPVIRNQKPFYRSLELSQIFNIEDKNSDSVPTLEKLLRDEVVEEKREEQVIEEPVFEEVTNEPKATNEQTVTSNLPAVRVEDIMLQNQALNSRILSLEDERDWLRRRVELLEERSAREQMLMLKEKETLSEIINATLVVKEKFSFTNYFKRIALPFFSSSDNK